MCFGSFAGVVVKHTFLRNVVLKYDMWNKRWVCSVRCWNPLIDLRKTETVPEGTGQNAPASSSTNACVVGINNSHRSVVKCTEDWRVDPHTQLRFCLRHWHMRHSWVDGQRYGKDTVRTYSDLFFSVVMSWNHVHSGNATTVSRG